jgi:glycerate 2-kinase
MRKRILVASGGFKDVLDPIQTCELIIKILNDVYPEGNIETDMLPMADGGEYSLEVLAHNLKRKTILAENIVNPTGGTNTIKYIELENNSVFFASSSVLSLPPHSKNEDKNPLLLTSYGIGQLIKKFRSKGYQSILLGLGGTSTADAGLGMMQALGCRFFGQGGNEIFPTRGQYFTGADISRVSYIKSGGVRENFSNTKIIALCDTNISVSQMTVPTSLKIGRYYKSERNEIVNFFTTHFEALCNNYDMHESKYGFHNDWLEDGSPYFEKPFLGVAGGIMLGLIKVSNTIPVLGANYLAKLFSLVDKLDSCDVVISAEGRFDISLLGKTPGYVAKLASTKDKPAILLCGRINDELKPYFNGYVSKDLPEQIKDHGVDTIITCNPFYENIEMPVNYDEEIQIYKNNTERLLFDAFRQYMEIEGTFL